MSVATIVDVVTNIDIICIFHISQVDLFQNVIFYDCNTLSLFSIKWNCLPIVAFSKMCFYRNLQWNLTRFVYLSISLMKKGLDLFKIYLNQSNISAQIPLNLKSSWLWWWYTFYLRLAHLVHHIVSRLLSLVTKMWIPKILQRLDMIFIRN